MLLRDALLRFLDHLMNVLKYIMHDEKTLSVILFNYLISAIIIDFLGGFLFGRSYLDESTDELKNKFGLILLPQKLSQNIERKTIYLPFIL